MELIFLHGAAAAGKLTAARALAELVGFPGRARTVVEQAGGRVHLVRLLVSEAEQERRLPLPSRQEFHKLTDPALLRHQRALPPDLDQPPVDLEIDTERSTAAASAGAIVARFGVQPQPPTARY